MNYKRNAEREVKEYSQCRTDANIDFVQSQIHRKNESTPYYSTGDIIKNSVNDLDHFPYDRFYRGIPESEYPVVFEREAGYRQRHEIPKLGVFYFTFSSRISAVCENNEPNNKCIQISSVRNTYWDICQKNLLKL